MTPTKQTGCVTWPECNFNFNQGIIAVCEEILCFSGVDPDHTNEKMTRCPQTNFHLQRSHIHLKQLSCLRCKLSHNMGGLGCIFIFFLPLGKLCLWWSFPNYIQIHWPLWASSPSVLLTKFWLEAPAWTWRVECRTSCWSTEASCHLWQTQQVLINMSMLIAGIGILEWDVSFF